MKILSLRKGLHRDLTAIKQYKEDNRPPIYLDKIRFDTDDTTRKE